MLFRSMLLVALTSVLLMGSAAQAYAVSSISNTFTANDYSISTNQSITLKAKTVFSQAGGIVTNPYPSNFMTEVSAKHFNKPVPYAWSGTPNPSSWTYLTTGDYVSPCYHYYSKQIWVLSPVTYYMNSTATVKSAAKGSKYGSRHGQRTTGGDSIGPAAWIYTTHN